MRNNVTSGLSLSFCLSVCAFMVLLSLSDRVYAKRGCSAFGHSCFGGHGKRFDPRVQDDALQNNAITFNDKHQEYEASPLGSKLFFSGSQHKFQGQEETQFPGTRRQNPQKFDPYTLSLLVGQWLASHRRLHHPELELNNK